MEFTLISLNHIGLQERLYSPSSEAFGMSRDHISHGSICLESNVRSSKVQNFL